MSEECKSYQERREAYTELPSSHRLAASFAPLSVFVGPSPFWQDKKTDEGTERVFGGYQVGVYVVGLEYVAERDQTPYLVDTVAGAGVFSWSAWETVRERVV